MMSYRLSDEPAKSEVLITYIVELVPFKGVIKSGDWEEFNDDSQVVQISGPDCGCRSQGLILCVWIIVICDYEEPTGGKVCRFRAEDLIGAEEHVCHRDRLFGRDQ